MLRTKKIKLKLNSIQKKKFDLWANHSRYSYNKAIGYINDNEDIEPDFRNYYKCFGKETDENHVIKNSRYTHYSKRELRDLIIPESVNFKSKWILETPKHIREYAVFEAYKNKKSCLTNKVNGNISHFNLRFKSKRNKSWTIGVPESSLNLYNNNSVGIYESRTTNFRVKTKEKINEINNDCLIHYDGINYFLCVPTTKEINKNVNQNFFAALDPGVRKFQTLYCPDENHFIKIGDRASNKIHELLLTLDNLISRRDKHKTKIYDRNILKLRIRIQNLQAELHYKTASYLCNNYSNIFIPKLTKDNDIIKRKNRKLTTKTVRKMVLLGHCKFIERLKTKAEEFANVQVSIITEEYTSQKCLRCCKNTKVTTEIYKCKNCNFTMDRDFLGSKNILLKNW